MHCPPPLRGREEARNAPGGGGAPARKVFSDTMKQGRCHHPRKPFPVTRKRQGRGKVPFPLPVSPSPDWRYPIDTVSRDLAVSSRSHRKLHEIPFPSRAPYPDYRHALPAPWKGAGGGRASGREAGVGRLLALKTVPGETQETGAGGGRASGRAAGVIDSLPEYRSR